MGHSNLPPAGCSRAQGTPGRPATRLPLWFPARGSGRFEVSAQLRQSEADEGGREGAVCGGGVGAYDRVQRGGAMHARLACVDLLVPVGRDEGGVGVQRDEGRAQRSCEGGGTRGV